MSIDTDVVVEPGKFVALTYTIYDLDGNTLEHNDLPMGFIYGGPQTLIGGMEDAVLGKRAGEVVEVLVPPERAFGHYDANLTYTDEIDNVPEEFRYIGAEVQMQNDAGDIKRFFVTRITGGYLTIDGNHPMAGKTLRVRVKILEVRESTLADLEGVQGTPVYH